MIDDKCEMIIGDGNRYQPDIECDQIAVGVTEDNILVCETCATGAENDGIKVTYYGDDC